MTLTRDTNLSATTSIVSILLYPEAVPSKAIPKAKEKRSSLCQPRCCKSEDRAELHGTENEGRSKLSAALLTTTGGEASKEFLTDTLSLGIQSEVWDFASCDGRKKFTRGLMPADLNVYIVQHRRTWTIGRHIWYWKIEEELQTGTIYLWIDARCAAAKDFDAHPQASLLAGSSCRSSSICDCAV